MINNESIARRAYELWEQAGKPEGRDAEYWLKAENELQDSGHTLKKVAAQALLKTPKPRKVVSR